YFKDDWKFRSDLTLNLGIHYEYYGQPYEHDGLAARVVGGENTFNNVNCTSNIGAIGSFYSTCSNLVQVQFVGKNSTHPDVLTNQGLAPLISRLIQNASGASPWRFEC